MSTVMPSPMGPLQPNLKPSAPTPTIPAPEKSKSTLEEENWITYLHAETETAGASAQPNAGNHLSGTAKLGGSSPLAGDNRPQAKRQESAGAGINDDASYLTPQRQQEQSLPSSPPLRNPYTPPTPGGGPQPQQDSGPDSHPIVSAASSSSYTTGRGSQPFPEDDQVAISTQPELVVAVSLPSSPVLRRALPPLPISRSHATIYQVS